MNSELEIDDLKHLHGSRGPITRYILKKWKKWITNESKEVGDGLGGLQCHVNKEIGNNKLSYVEGIGDDQPDPFGGAITGKK